MPPRLGVGVVRRMRYTTRQREGSVNIMQRFFLSRPVVLLDVCALKDLLRSACVEGSDVTFELVFLLRSRRCNIIPSRIELLAQSGCGTWDRVCRLECHHISCSRFDAHTAKTSPAATEQQSYHVMSYHVTTDQGKAAETSFPNKNI